MRYIVLILINIPVIFLALLSLTTKYKMGKIDSNRYRWQIVFWLALFILLASSFPIYNILTGRPALESSTLSFFDIVQTTAVIVLLYIVNTQRQKSEQIERRLRDLHQELSIQLSDKEK